MTAAEILRSAQPPSDDGMIEKAIAELDVKLFEWTDALKSAHAQLRSAFAVRPSAARPSQALYEGLSSVPPPAAALPPSSSISASLAETAAAVHMPTPPPLPQWATPTAEEAPAWTPPIAPQSPAWAPAAQPPAWAPSGSAGSEWPQQPTQNVSQFGGHGISSSGPQQQDTGAMQWPTTPPSSWPESPAASSGSQQWPTWSPTDTSAPQQKKSSVRATRAPKAVRPTLTEGPTPEERAQRAAAEEALLSQLEDAIARRVRLLRRLDPDTAIEKLIDKARQGHAESMAQPQQTKDDKSSWWRRK